MAVIPAQIQSVNSSYEDPNYQNPFLSAVNAGLQGYFAKKNMNQDMIVSAFPNLVATKQVRPAKPGEQTILPNVPWAWKDSANLSDFKDLVSIQNTMDLINNRNKEKAFTMNNAYKALVDSPYGLERMMADPLPGQSPTQPALDMAKRMKDLVTAVNAYKPDENEDPVMVAIKKAKAGGMTDEEIRANLEEEGITPSDYGY